MLKTVPKLKKFGIFRDFLWSNSTSDFAHFNLIYGWNKSGKTTLSRVFVACEKESTNFKKYPKEMRHRGQISTFDIKIKRMNKPLDWF